MKKSFKALTLGLLTVGMLAACGKPAPAPDWSSEQKAIMTEHLYGEVLPYVSGQNLEIKFDPAKDEVVITADELASTAVAALASKFTVEDGWTDESEADSDAYVFEKQTVNADQAKRWVYVTFGNQTINQQTNSEIAVSNEGEETLPTKQFVLRAFDPYFYSFPADEFAAAVKRMTGGDSGEVVSFPNFAAERYYSDPTSGLVFAFTDDANSAATYAATLRNEPYNYHVDNEEGSYIAYNDNQGFGLMFSYIASVKAVAFDISNYPDWPGIALGKALDQLIPENRKDTLPEYEQDFTTVFANFFAKDPEDADDEDTVQLQVFFDEGTTESPVTEAQAAANYQATLAKTFTTKYLSGSPIFVSPNNELRVYTSYNATRYPGCFFAFATKYDATEKFDLDAYPADEMAAYLTSKNITTANLPAPELQARSYKFVSYDVEDGADPQGIAILYGAGSATPAASDYQSYVTKLTTDCGYKISSSSGASTYLMKDGASTIDHRVLVRSSGGNVYIHVFPIDASVAFPMDKVIAELGVGNDFYPSFELANSEYFEYSVSLVGEDVYVSCNFVDKAAADAAVVALDTAFGNAEAWTEAGEGVYTAQGGIYTVEFYASTSNNKVVIVEFSKIIFYEDLPRQLITSRLGFGAAATNILVPAVSGTDTATYWYLITTQYTNGTGIQAVGQYASADEAATVAAAFKTAMDNAVATVQYYVYRSAQNDYYINFGEYAVFAECKYTAGNSSVVFEYTFVWLS